MKVYLSVDMEGIGGISHADPTTRGDLGYPAAVALMVGEANAAIDGAYAGGADEVVVNDSHGTMFNLTPLDLEREFGLVGGDIFHGKLTLNQLFSARPVLGYGNYRMPLKGLYLCGSGAHPGGGVTGVPGHNAAREIVRDLRRRRL